ncbi:3-methyl-2-oxobutanoate hydroxymethyltransferase [Rhodovulum sp. FJ3]|uniref:3-methyl-2-oxobutanoate hydroxymethyltransferase n=1 Tax=Rhodovulum sp. FJ3 TaxID=3079053 RepID=UPI00293DB289|nr:3-methyl-2-oxobutanoate hydroxymethyltransferase [Rhodovulum sp. FJ3]MDV4169288.1 3-methyl-2-oxobutanoate hydroxymethyltransferase [Rhodovulum sp. FJ3]
MSATNVIKSLTASDIRGMKGDTPIVCLTAYTTPVAEIADTACDLILVGDSVGMVLHGLPSTLGVTMDMMVMHAKAVARGTKRALIVVDMPFGSYEQSPEQAFENASRLMVETGCGAVKLEGGVDMAPTIAFLVKRGIPVMAHIGLTPQAVNTFGGYKVQGRGDDGDRLMADARAVDEAGAFSVVIEKVPASLGDKITAEISIPTVGIGAGAGCDGQVLVVDDMMGMFTNFKPKFVKRYATVRAEGERAVAEYAEEVRARTFPGPEHTFADEVKK